MAITFAASADKRGVPHEDTMYAIANAVDSEEDFSEPRVPGRGKPTLFIGQPRDVFIFPAMEARPKILDKDER